MSEDVLYKGILKPIPLADGETYEDFARKECEKNNIVKSNIYNNYIEALVDHYWNPEKYFFHEKSQILYIIDNTEYDPYNEIIEATENYDGSVEYILKYHNGGAGFDECLEEALDKMKKNKNNTENG